jgi:hypothetical protein
MCTIRVVIKSSWKYWDLSDLHTHVQWLPCLQVEKTWCMGPDFLCNHHSDEICHLSVLLRGALVHHGKLPTVELLVIKADLPNKRRD